jgi:lipoprotein-anchoring transpeptidase ErfK/SrfK
MLWARLFPLLLACLPVLGVAAPLITYSVATKSDLQSLSPEEIDLLEKLNRRDRRNLQRADRVVMPSRFDLDTLEYSPLPRFSEWAAAQDLKAYVVDLRSQVFGAYEFGNLVRWGPVSSGRERYPTPPGDFHLNWRARSRRSTDNQNWLMEWYFNFHNSRGIAFHKYSLPGRPASHACVRLLERDAKWLYDWGEQWTLSSDRQDVLDPGTPLWIVGQYEFGAPPPWLDPQWWDQPITLPEREISEISGSPAA